MPPLYSELVFHAVDLSVPKPQTAEMRIPVTPFDTTDTSLATYLGTANQIAGSFGSASSSHIAQVGLSKVTLVIDLGIAAVTALDGSDVREIWELTTDLPDSFRFAVPGANTVNALIQPGSKHQLANLSASAWTTFLAALSGVGTTVNLVNAESGANATIGAGRATVRARARPRV